MPRSPVSLRVRHHRRGTRSGSPEERCDRLYLERSARTAGTCGPPSLGRSPGTRSTQAGRRTDSSPRLLRSSDRSAQPCPSPRPPEPDSSQLPPRQHIGGSVADESGPLQGHQRHPWAPEWGLSVEDVALRLRSALEESTQIARLGGDEFAVVLRADAKGAILLAQTLLKALDDPFVLEGLPVDVRASLGIALFPEHGADADTLLRRADVALHVANGTGSGVAVYTSEQDRYHPERLALMGELRQGMASGQLVLNYQPMINLKTGQVIGVEVLMRWQH